MIGSATERNGLYHLDTKEEGKVKAYLMKGTIEGFFESNLLMYEKIRTSNFYLPTIVVS